MNLSKTYFLKSVLSLNNLPEDSGVEVAFAGRSNAGKSSALNAITRIGKLAKTSKTPGRTQAINYFCVEDPKYRLVDLPGYGYAKVAQDLKKQWQALLDAYFQNRQSLKGLFLIMDIRHPLMPFDKIMLTWASFAKIPVHILLTKADKLNKSPAKNTLLQVQKQIKNLENLENLNYSIQLFSSHAPLGTEEAKNKLLQWLSPGQI
ncbi:MAG: ribosome biogenesis GTP-binding protein YihA/YsxC [Gammaproteobacteria bacterium]